MKTKKIYIIRHGETDFNKKGMVQGRGVDASLNDTGNAQSNLFYEKYKNYSFDKIYTSTLKRTIETVTKFLDKGIAHSELEGLDEISWGSHEGKPFSVEMNADHKKVMKEWSDGFLDENVGGGESPNQVMKRQKIAFDEILSDGSKKILIATHGRAMRIMLCHLLNYPLSNMDIFEHQNLCLYVLSYNGSTFSVVKHNDIEHLK